MANTSLIRVNNNKKGPKNTVIVPFKDLTMEQFNACFLNNEHMTAIKAALNHMIDVQEALVGGCCPKCKTEFTRWSTGPTDRLVCANPECRYKLTTATRHEDSNGRQIYAVDLPKKEKIDGEWVTTTKKFNPFSKNTRSLPSVIFVAWSLLTGYIPENIFLNKKKEDLEEVIRVMRALHCWKLGTEKDLIEVGLALIQLIKDPKHDGLGRDFLGVVRLPKNLKPSTVDWPASNFDAGYQARQQAAEVAKASVAAEEAKKAEEVKWADDHLGLRHVNDLFGKADINKVKKAIDLTRSCRHSAAVFQITGYAWVMSNISASEGNYDALNDAKYLFPEFNESEAYSVYFRFAQQGFTAHSLAAMILEKEHGGITEEDLTEIFNKGVQAYYPESKEVFWSITLFKGVLKKLRGYDMPDRDVQEFFLRRKDGTGFFPEEPKPEPVVSTPASESEPVTSPEPEPEPDLEQAAAAE
jgi:hypothetical protein